jgi:predicted RNase H-like nuclease (RuvC/YqgF family)
MEQFKITVLTVEGEPSFVIEGDDASNPKRVNKIIDERWGVRRKKGRILKHEWFSQKLDLKKEEDEILLLNKKVIDLEELVEQQKEENRRLKRKMQDFKKCILLAYTRIACVNRVIRFDWIENHPLKSDINEAEKKVEELLIRLKIEDLEEKLIK